MKKIDVIRIYQRKKALVVDDFPDMRISLKTMLKNMGCDHVDSASNGKEAVAQCENNSYDIVLCDYNMGVGKTGQQVLEEVRFRGLLKNTALYVMITAESSRDMVNGALEYMPDDYLTKPFTQAVLESRLNRLVIEKELLQKIYQAMDQKDYSTAIELCKQESAQHNRFKLKCSRIMAWCLYENRQYDEAQKVYDAILCERELEWAQIGHAKCLIAAKHLDDAEQHLQKMLDHSPNNTEALDLMAEVQNKKGDHVYAQQLLQKAADISPRAILRQKELAKVCSANGDWPTARHAFNEAINLGNNSCYESPENYFDYARCVSTELKSSQEKDTTLIGGAEQVLTKARKKYKGDNNIILQSDLINANIYKHAGDETEFENRKEDLLDRMDECRNPPPELSMDMAQSYQAMDMNDQATKLLRNLAERFGDDPSICEMIDRISEEPITEHGKEQAADLNEQAKTLFDKNDYRSAIKLIDEAIYIFPNNKTLNINLLTALVKQMQSHTANKKWISKCDDVIARVGDLHEEDFQYQRYQSLCSELDTLRNSAS